MGLITEIDAYTLEWEVIHWKWLIRNLGSRFDIDRIKLITPTPEILPVVSGTADQRANAVFRCVQKCFGLEAVPCRLESCDDALARPETRSWAAALSEAASSQEVVIRYKPSQLDDPMALVATMAQGMSRHVLTTIKEAPPRGWGSFWSITDLTVVFFGFGIFLANSAFAFDVTPSKDSRYQALSTYRVALLEESLSLAVALFCTSKKLPLEPVERYLGSNSRVYFRAYCRELLKHHRKIVSQLPVATKISRRAGFLCPRCRMAPLIGEFWTCLSCGVNFDTFKTQAQCPSCNEKYATTGCPTCGCNFPINQWRSRTKGEAPKKSRVRSKARK